MNLVLCAMIVAICTAMGRVFAGRMAERLAFFKDYQIAYTQLSDSMVGINLELYKALKSCRAERIKPLFEGCADLLKKKPQASFSQIWQMSFMGLKPGFGYLSKDDAAIVLEGGGAVETLCMNPSEKQAGLYLKRLSLYTADITAEKTKKCKLYNTAGVLAGLMIALLVI